VVDGGAGNDVICGDDGADVLRGGPGADRLLGGLEDTDPDERLAGDALTGGPGDDYLDPGYDPSGHPDRDDLRWADASRGVTIDLADGVTGTATGVGRDTLVLAGGPVLVGSRHDDTFRGSPLLDRIHAGGGSDTIYAGMGDDEIHPDRGSEDARSADLVRTGAGDDSVFAFAGRDRVFLGKGRDQFSGSAAQNVEVHGEQGSDFISAQIAAGSGLLLRGDQGRDFVTLLTAFADQPLRTVVVEARSARLAGFENYVLGGTAHWDFRGTPGPDHVQAFSGFGVRLTAHTYGGNDYVEGSDANDVIDAGAGRDRVLAADGRDTCLHVERRTSCEITH
jgi:Ca2+-binding RTX toxin-like protein